MLFPRVKFNSRKALEEGLGGRPARKACEEGLRGRPARKACEEGLTSFK